MVKVNRLVVSGADFKRLDEEERLFVLMAGHLANELHALNKLLAYLSRDYANEIVQKAQTTWFLILLRVLAGKLIEAWSSPLRATLGTEFPHFTRTAPIRSSSRTCNSSKHTSATPISCTRSARDSRSTTHPMTYSSACSNSMKTRNLKCFYQVEGATASTTFRRLRCQAPSLSLLD